MEYRILGRTGLEVSALSFGTAPISGMYGAIDKAAAQRAVKYAVDCGINLFDICPDYGNDSVESLVKDALGRRRAEVILAVKAGRFDRRRFDYSRPYIKKSVEYSLRNLGTDHVDILNIQDIEYGDREQVLNEAYGAALELKKEGKCRFIGMSGYPLACLREAVETCGLDVVLTYGHFNLLNGLMLTELLPYAEQNGIGVINAGATALGLLTRRVLKAGGVQEWHPAPQSLVRVCRRIVQYLLDIGIEPVEFALEYIFWEKTVPTTIVGMSEWQHVEQNLKTISNRPNQQVLESVMSLIKPVNDLTWAESSWTE